MKRINKDKKQERKSSNDSAYDENNFEETKKFKVHTQ